MKKMKKILENKKYYYVKKEKKMSFILIKIN